MDVGKRYLSIKVAVSEGELAELRAKARAHALSVSSYIRWRAVYPELTAPLEPAVAGEG
jgi:hypothetical protein